MIDTVFEGKGKEIVDCVIQKYESHKQQENAAAALVRLFDREIRKEVREYSGLLKHKIEAALIKGVKTRLEELEKEAEKIEQKEAAFLAYELKTYY